MIRRTLTTLVSQDDWERYLQGQQIDLFPYKEGYVVVLDGRNISDKGIVVAAHYEPLDAENAEGV